MASETAKEAWDRLKEEFHGSDKIRQIKVINLRREFEILRMKDSEIIEEFSNKLMKYIWKSQTYGLFTVTRDVNVEQLGRGTKITLFLKEDQLKYLEEQRIKDLVKKHSEFISYPIYLWAEKTTEKEISNDEDDEPKKDNEGSSKQALLKLTQDQGGNYLFEFDSFPDDTRLRWSFDLYHLTMTSVGTFLPHQLNLVGKSKSTSEKPNVPHDEQLTNTEMGRWIKLLQKLHRQLVIGGVLLEAEFWAVRKRLLEQTENKKPKQQTKYSRAEYLHSTKNVVATFAEVSEDEEHAVFLKQDAMLESEARKKMNNIKLYVWRVFIMDNCEEPMPEYLGFLKGVVDSDDLSLNISHEMLQQNEILKVIRKNLVKKCIVMFNEIEAR
ncbi:Heat shock protein 83 [Capsicum chinense]|nr:Heat shock protein 83 [Capsicum chinense]